MTAYVCIAHRYGNLNAHQYVVYVGDDLVKARALAAAEPPDRGGKYGVGVYEYVERDGDGGTSMVDYYPSCWGEERPHHNWRIDAFESLGHFAHDAAEGEIWVPGGENNTMLRQKVDCPDWLKAEVERRMKFADEAERITQEKSA